MLLADVPVRDCLAEFALDVATPDEFTEAALGVFLDERVVAAAAAQGVAGVGPGRPELTLPARRAQHPGDGVRLAVIRRLLDEDQFVVLDAEFTHGFFPAA